MNAQQIAATSAPIAAASNEAKQTKGKAKAKTPKQAKPAKAENLLVIKANKACATIDTARMQLVIRGIMDEAAKAVEIANAAGFHIEVKAADRQTVRVTNMTSMRKAKALLSSDPAKANEKLKRIARMNKFLDMAEELGFCF
jgi:hypothetical protein